ncbi:MAG: FAD-dependent oxidoreductase [Aquihabitans sp.]
MTGEVARLVIEDDHLTGVELADGRVVPRAAVFVRPGIHPHPDGLLVGLGCTSDETGFVTTDSTGRTSNPGVWAAGNVADARAQVITAAGAGSAAAIAINNDLVQADVDRAVRTHHDFGRSPVGPFSPWAASSRPDRVDSVAHAPALPCESSELDSIAGPDLVLQAREVCFDGAE